MADRHCSVNGCEKKNKIVKGLCNMHYLRLKRYGDVNFVKSMKTPKGTKCKIEGCDRLAKRKLMCEKHHSRHKAHGDPHFRVNKTYGEPYKWLCKFLKSIPDTDECIEWPFKKCRLGYGRVRATEESIAGDSQAHRYVLKSVEKEPDAYMHCAHSCGNRGCINPKHLRWATPKENTDDRKGHGTWGLKLTKDMAIAIYQSNGRFKVIADKYSISETTVYEIKNGITWSWVTGHVR